MSERVAVRWQLVAGRRRPALLAAVMLALGIVLARYVPATPLIWGIVTLLGLFGLLHVTRGYSSITFIAALLVWLGLGAFRYAGDTQLVPTDHISRFIDPPRNVGIFGRIVDLPDQRQYATNLVLEVRSLEDDGRRYPVSGRILIRVRDTDRHFSFGDFLRFTAELEHPHEARNPGGFDYRRFLFHRGIYAMADVSQKCRITIYPDPDGAAFFNRLIIPLREYILAVFRDRLPGVPGTLLAGYLLGETRDMPAELYDAYRQSGTLHLLAVSGSNVWLILGLFWLVFRTLRVPRVIQIILLLSILVVFCFVTRNDPSVVRAGIMAGLVLSGLLFRQRIDMLNIVGVSAVIILLVAPRHLFLAGFQLSYAAVLGIIVFVPRLVRIFPGNPRRPLVHWCVTLLASSLAATAATAPILAIHFSVIPAISVLANLVMVPLAGLLTNCAVVLVLAHDLWPWAAQFIAAVAKSMTDISIWCATQFQTTPGGTIHWPNPGFFEVINYLLAVFVVLVIPTRYQWYKPTVFYGLIVTGICLAGLALSNPSSQAEVMFFDAGWQQLIGLRVPGDGHPRLVGSPAAFTPANRQWIIEPFCIQAGWSVGCLQQDTLAQMRNSITEWQSLSWDSSTAPKARSDDVFHHIRFINKSEAGNYPVADFLLYGNNSALLIYNADPGLVRVLQHHVAVSGVELLGLPAALPTSGLLEAVTHLEFKTLVLCGGPYPDDRTNIKAMWGRHFPERQVLATSADGGIQVFLHRSRLVVSTNHF